jgi:hypothetical protein
MLVTIKERIWREITLAGLPLRIYHTFQLGAHGQKQYDMQGLFHGDEDGKVPPEELQRMREHTKAAALRTKELRKAAKRLTISFHVEQS